VKESGKQSCGIFPGLFFDPEDGGDMFLTSAMRTTNHTRVRIFYTILL
jgi:hypothetical protein